MSRVTHFEIHADDPERAIGFYSACFGWSFHKWEGPVDYWLITTGPTDKHGINGGMIRRRGGIDGKAIIAYVCTIDVAAIDHAAATIESAGGEIVVPKQAIPGVGWLFHFKDTEGNVVGCMQTDPNAA